ncbi:MAG: hypothetical protein H7Z71_02845 [Moraxellaceae bacterium]|nr:hypothetical protein [Pseudobdellovibrionaceae bacterium]
MKMIQKYDIILRQRQKKLDQFVPFLINHAQCEEPAKTKLLAELVEHNIQKEECNILRKVKKMITIEERFEMGQKYIEFKAQYVFPIKANHLGDS